VPLVITFDAILGMVSYIVGQHLLVAAWGHLPAQLCGAVHGHLIVGGVLDGDTAWLLKRALEEVALSALAWALLTPTGQHAWATQVGLAMSLWLIVPSLPRP
jgi:hypothetical protein